MKIFLLTREYKQTSQGLTLCFWGTNGEEPVKILVTGQSAVCFLPSEVKLDNELSGIPIKRKALELKTLDDVNVDGLYFDSQFRLRDFSMLARERGISLYESDVKPTERFLMERFITASCEVVGEVEHSNTSTKVFINPKLKNKTF